LLPKEWEDFFNLMPRMMKRIYEKKSDEEPKPMLEYTAAQINTLRAIAGKDEWRMSDLSHRLRVSAGSLTTMINRLIEAGLVERTRSQLDRRVVTVKLTEKGRQLLQASKQRAMRRLHALLDDLPPQEQARLNNALSEVVDVLRQIF
jgi:DNA-binding MarR family transcriptional regulator